MTDEIGIITKVRDENGRPYNPNNVPCSFVARNLVLVSLVEQGGLPGAAYAILSSNGVPPKKMEEYMDEFRKQAAERLCAQDFSDGLSTLFPSKDGRTTPLLPLGIERTLLQPDGQIRAKFCSDMLNILTKKKE